MADDDRAFAAVAAPYLRELIHHFKYYFAEPLNCRAGFFKIPKPANEIQEAVLDAFLAEIRGEGNPPGLSEGHFQRRATR